jgi:hypothetical protein
MSQTPNRGLRNLRPPPIQTNFTNERIPPLRRARARRNFINNNNIEDQEIQRVPLSFGNSPVRHNNINVEEYEEYQDNEVYSGYIQLITMLTEQEKIINIKNPKHIKVDNTISVYDFIEVETLEINPFVYDPDNIYFKANNFYFRYSRNEILNHLGSQQNIIFECNKVLQGAPYIKDVDFNSPYYLLRANGNFAIPYSEMAQTINNKKWFAYELHKTKHLPHTSAVESIVFDYTGKGLLRQQVDIMSADHCQAGTDRDVYELTPILFRKSDDTNSNIEAESKYLKKRQNVINENQRLENEEFREVNGGRRKQKGRGLKSSKTLKKKNNSFKVHTLRGKKKNIEKQKKSMKKAKKILGVN